MTWVLRALHLSRTGQNAYLEILLKFPLYKSPETGYYIIDMKRDDAGRACPLPQREPNAGWNFGRTGDGESPASAAALKAVGADGSPRHRR